MTRRHLAQRSLDYIYGGKPKTRKSQTKPRNQTIEALRIAAAFGIVLFHAAAPGAAVGYAGLVVFVALAAMFAGERREGLWKRLLVPWAFWMVAYGVLRAFVLGGFDAPPAVILLYGTSPHLWFLPFVFVVTWAIWLVKPGRWPLVMVALAVPLLVLGHDYPPPVAQWMHALPAVFIGLAMPDRMGRIAACLVVVAMFAVGYASIAYVVGTLALAAAVALPLTRFNVEAVSRCMYGTYLVHPLALAVFNRITGEHSIVTVALAFFASAAGVFVARQLVPRSKAVLG